MFPDLEYMKTLVNGLKTRLERTEAKLKKVLSVETELLKTRPDWNENNPNDLEYVKNRTHWTEWSKDTEVFNSGEITVTDTYYDSTQFYYNNENLPKLSFVKGDKYRIEISGLSFDVIADRENDISWVDENGIYWGIGVNTNNGIVYFFGANRGVTSVPFTTTVKVTHLSKEITHPIPEKFIPETVARKSDIPAYLTIPVVRADGDGVNYTATIGGITDVYDGLMIVIVPNKKSNSVSPTLNVNNRGGRTIVKVGNKTHLYSSLPNSDALSAGYPAVLMFNGFYWVILNII